MKHRIFANDLIFTTFVERRHAADLARLKAGGAAGLEVSFFQGSAEHWSDVAQMCKDSGLATESAVTMLAKDADISSRDPEVRTAGVKALRQKIDWCHAMAEVNPSGDGTPFTLCGPLVLPWGEWPQAAGGAILGNDLAAEVAERIRIAGDSLAELAPIAAAAKVRLCIEYLTHWEIPGPNNIVQVFDLVRAVNSKFVGVHIDSSHEVHSGLGAKAFAAVVAELEAGGFPFWLHLSTPDRGGLANSWLPWQEFLMPFAAIDRPLRFVVEVFNNVDPFATGCRLTRAAFPDPVGQMVEDIQFAARKVEAFFTDIDVRV